MLNGTEVCLALVSCISPICLALVQHYRALYMIERECSLKAKEMYKRHMKERDELTAQITAVYQYQAGLAMRKKFDCESIDKVHLN